MTWLLTSAAFLALSATADTLPSCDDLSVSAVQVSGQTYDPAQLSAHLVRLAVETNVGSRDCVPARVVIQGRDGAGQMLLKRMGEVLTALPVASETVEHAGPSRIELSASARRALGRDGRVVVDLFEILPGQFAPAGDYLAELEWLIEEMPPQPIEIAVRVEPAVRFVGDSIRSLSLGDVSDGGEARSTFFYATNANLRVVARSQHGGRLEHEAGPAFGAIPYTAYLSGRKLDLSAPGSAILPYQRTRLASEELRVEATPQTGRFGGSYRDVLTLEFTAY